MIRDILSKRRFDIDSDRLGPDCPFTHWRLYFKSSMKKICQDKFKQFSESSEFRAGAYAITCSKISLGQRVVIRPNTMLFADPRVGEGYIVIEDNVMVGSGVHIYVSNHRYDLKDKDIIDQGHYRAEDVLLKKGCWIGANSIILAGVTIGQNAVVGTGSIVTKDIPDGAVYVGNPARAIEKNKKF
jgi:acetyltransferase-like isoleucine patch superfamily enzyme